MKSRWLYPRQIASFLGVSRQTATKLIRRIPGAVLMYPYENRPGERWRVSLEDYRKWRESLRARTARKLDNGASDQ